MALLFGFLTELFIFLLSFLLVFALVYGVLSKTKFLTASAAVNSLIAFAIGLLFAFTGFYKFIFAIIPYFAILMVIFASVFLLMFFFGYKLQDMDDKQKKIVVWIFVGISIVFVFFAGWKLYYDDVHQMYELYSLQNTNINESALSANYTGNPFHDIPLRYEYHCTLQGRYLAPVMFFGQGGILCLIMHPRVIGALIILPIIALAVYIITRFNMPKKIKSS